MALFKKLTCAVLFTATFFLVKQIVRASDCSVCTSSSTISECEQSISCLGNQKVSLSSQIELIDTKITLTKSQINQTQNKIDKLTDNIGSVSGKITSLENSLAGVSTVLANRIAQTYMVGRNDPALYLLSATNFADFWQRFEYLRIVQKHDKELMIQMAASRKNYNDQKTDLEDMKKKKEVLSAQLNNQKAQYDVQNKQKQALLATTQVQFDQAVAQLAAFRNFVNSQGGAGLLSGQTKCDDWGCYYNQRDTNWGGTSLNHTSDSIAEVGCLVTSMAMVITHYGHKNVTPLTINNNSDNFSQSNPAYLNKTINADGTWRRETIAYSYSSSLIDNELKNGPVVIGIGSGPSHFVVIVSGSNGNYQMNDPYFENGSKISFTSKYSLGSISEIDKVKQN